MAVMGLRLAGRSNAVSKLHGEVSRDMFADLWPDVPSRRGADHVGHERRARAARGSSPRWTTCSRRYVLPEWDEAGPRALGRTSPTPADDELWRVHRAGPRPTRRVRPSPLRTAAAERGVSVARHRRGRTSVLDPECAHDLLRPALRHLQAGRRCCCPSPSGCSACCCPRERPVQFVFAGKAHPADEAGKEMIRQIVHVRRPTLGVRHRFIFLDGLRHRRRPGALPRRRRVAEQPAPAARGVRHERHEGRAERRRSTARSSTAGGTSCSTARTAGRSPRPRTSRTSTGGTRWRPTACSTCLEHQIVPLFYDRDSSSVPRRWIGRVKHALAIARAGCRGITHGARLRHGAVRTDGRPS